MAVQGQGAAPRNDSLGQSTLLRPAYSFNAGIFKPTVPSSFTHIFDVRSVLFWRLLIAGLAVGYIWGWHVKLPGVGRVRL